MIWESNGNLLGLGLLGLTSQVQNIIFYEHKMLKHYFMYIDIGMQHAAHSIEVMNQRYSMYIGMQHTHQKQGVLIEHELKQV